MWDALKGSWAPVWAASWRISSVEGYEGDEIVGKPERSSVTLDGTVPRLLGLIPIEVGR